jgi:MFS transporter, DHA2 family, glioxin efflux transporter
VERMLTNISVFQTLGGAFAVSAAQAAFVNQIIFNLPTTAPGVSPESVIATGVTQIRTVFNADQVPGILLAYMTGIKAAIAVSIGTIGLSFIVSFLSKWDRIGVDSSKGQSMG